MEATGHRMLHKNPGHRPYAVSFCHIFGPAQCLRFFVMITPAGYGLDSTSSAPGSGSRSCKGYPRRPIFGLGRPGRSKTLDFEFYAPVRLRIWGDGRTYIVNIHSYADIDVHFLDLYQFPLYTRGGPYWQDVIIPYSKFILTHRGAIQDKQESLVPENVSNIGIALMDRINGPFHLELSEVELIKHEGHTALLEDHAYEKYRMPHGLYLGTEM